MSFIFVTTFLGVLISRTAAATIPLVIPKSPDLSGPDEVPSVVGPLPTVPVQPAVLFVSKPGIGVPTVPGAGLPSLPGLEITTPRLPGLPGITGVPGLPTLPNIPGLPDLQGATSFLQVIYLLGQVIQLLAANPIIALTNGFQLLVG